VKLFQKSSNAYDHSPPTLDRRTDRQLIMAIPRSATLRAVKNHNRGRLGYSHSVAPNSINAKEHEHPQILGGIGAPTGKVRSSTIWSSAALATFFGRGGDRHYGVAAYGPSSCEIRAGHFTVSVQETTENVPVLG